MSKVAVWNMRCNKSPMQRKTPEWKKAMLNQLARIQEELDETIAGVGDMDENEVLDGLTDIQVVFEGAVFLSGLPVDEAFERVMANNDLKFTQNYEEAELAVEHHGIDHFHVQEYQELTEPDEHGNQFNVGKPYYSVHRNKDNKICKLLNHPRVDLSDLVEV